MTTTATNQSATPQALHKLPQALRSGFASRLRLDQTSLFVSTVPVTRSNKRSSAAISYAEIDEDYDEDEDSGRGSVPGTPRLVNGLLNGTNGGSGTPGSPAGRGGSGGSGTYYSQPLGDKPETKAFVNPVHVAKLRHMLRYNDVQLREAAGNEEVLVPIRLNLEYDNFRISDCFLWNLNEKVLTPEMFAISLCQDLELPIAGGPGGIGALGGPVVVETSSIPSTLAQSLAHTNYVNQIASTIHTQLHEYTTFANVKLPQETGFHVIISLSVNLNKQVYEDKFEWDLSNSSSLKAEERSGVRDSGLTPLEFAKTVVQDLGLSGEFYPAIAHAVYESIYRVKKEALDGHLPPQEVENYAAFGLEAGWRVEQEMLGEEWAPSVETLSQEEIEKREIERERNIRRLKRESARMGGAATSSFDGFVDGTMSGENFGRGKRRRRGESPAWH
ncbi:uncharacterized protein SAPINGB_P000394 [Magnusiomyces paraingens]|uniref:Chromatin structure-remodeling complex subunit SFH1 n=1 Tax=Magnusiomyces paraingens TaxID=2606893 RepID=A0A5E8AYY3_9ASCO|nr:uncharacterized protein SAPINGB_P000394 [Saprochaete ingens]VVT44372.1 unnamed protein product [Saprochaete ingens]